MHSCGENSGPGIILVLNQGLKSTRCIAFSVEGRMLARASRPIETYVSNERVEQCPRTWLELAREVVREAVGWLGQAAGRVDCITVTTSASCLVVLDEHGVALRNSILVSDARAAREAADLAATAEFRAVLDRTGIKSSTDLMLPKMIWLARHEPEMFKRAAHFLNAGDYLVHWLTGQCVTDPNSALKFHYLAADDAYPVRLLESLGIDADRLPRVVATGTDLGSLLPDVAADLGLPATCGLMVSSYDAICAVTGTGVFETGEAVDVSGTVTSFRAVTDRPVVDPRGRVYVSPHIGPDRWLVGGSNNLGGGVIEWLRQLLYARDDDPHETMNAEGGSQPPCPGGLLFLPHLLGERAPLWNPDCRGVLFGLNRSHSRPQIARAVFEGVSFGVLQIAGVLRELDVPVDRVTVSGGLARLDTINRIKADMLGVPVRTLKNFETTSIGAALLCLVGRGVFSKEEGVGRFCRVDCSYEPDPARHDLYAEYFDLYCRVYDSLRGAYTMRADLMRRLQAAGVDDLSSRENL